MTTKLVAAFAIIGANILFQVTYSTEEEPCTNFTVLDNGWHSYTQEVGNCSNSFDEGWYRVTSVADEQVSVPLVCQTFGWCVNKGRIFIQKDNIPDDSILPSVGETVDRNAKLYKGCNNFRIHFTIQIKGCNEHYVYRFRPVTNCSVIYCLRDKIPCPVGTYSETGFEPNCTSYPAITVSPYVTPNLMRTEAVNEYNYEMVYNRLTFECHANDLSADHTYKVRWYVNNQEIENAMLKNLSYDDILRGHGRMLEEHWTPTFKPNMYVKCSIQVGGEGFIGYGPPFTSDNFFAGLKIEQNDYVVLEGKHIEIPVELTIPLSCDWQKDTINLDFIQSKACYIVILNTLPSYQTDEKECQNGIKADGVVFDDEACGINFSYKTWNQTQVINITGESDQMVNTVDRFVFLRLNADSSVTPRQELSYWKNFEAPEIKVVIKDADITTLGQNCYSYNDPHMRTFDGKVWELQISNGLTAGEYIMYKHNRLPLQVSAYFKPCRRTVLCNCGVAVRNGNSLFVANFCSTVYEGVHRINRYMILRSCDGQSLEVQKTSTSYTITLPTGTKVTFNYGSDWIDGINITPSVLDRDLTDGLCGKFNEDSADDFTPRNESEPVTSNKLFASSWLVNGSYAEETLFDPEGKLKTIESFGDQYCSCVSPKEIFPHGSPDFNCDLTAAMETCRETTHVFGVYTANCVTDVVRKKRFAHAMEIGSVGMKEDDEPVSFPMVTEEISVTSELLVEWKNNWTEETARSYCRNKFQAAPAYDICSEYVPSIDTEPFISGCILDIKHTGDDSWLKVTLKNYASSCLQESKRLENLTSTNSTNSTGFAKSIAEIIEESTCPDNCSNNGFCRAGECRCDLGFFGELCNGTRSQPPRIIKEAFEDLCDTNIKSCKTFLLYGDNFIDGVDFKCKFTEIQLRQNGLTTTLEEGETFIHPGTYATPQYMKCKLPESRKKRSADKVVAATGYRISISNDGTSYTDSVTTIVYDSNCYLCNSTSLICEKQDSCPFQEPVEPEKDNIPIIAIAAAASGAGLVFLVVITILVLKKCNSKKKSIGDSSLSLPNTCRQMPPRSHMLRDIFLFEKQK